MLQGRIKAEDEIVKTTVQLVRCEQTANFKCRWIVIGLVNGVTPVYLGFPTLWCFNAIIYPSLDKMCIFKQSLNLQEFMLLGDLNVKKNNQPQQERESERCSHH